MCYNRTITNRDYREEGQDVPYSSISTIPCMGNGIAQPNDLGYIPTVIQQTSNGERQFDIYSRLLDSRIIFITGEVDKLSMDNAIAQLFHLESVDPTKDITLYVNTPGGDVQAGMALIDVMNYIRPDVCTVCTGLAASMGSLILSSGAKGKRFCLPHSEVLIHQPLIGGISGQQTEIAIAAKGMERCRKMITEVLAKNTGKPFETVYKDTERDNSMTAKEAMEYGLVDGILEHHGDK